MATRQPFIVVPNTHKENMLFTIAVTFPKENREGRAGSSGITLFRLILLDINFLNGAMVTRNAWITGADLSKAEIVLEK